MATWSERNLQSFNWQREDSNLGSLDSDVDVVIATPQQGVETPATSLPFRTTMRGMGLGVRGDRSSNPPAVVSKRGQIRSPHTTCIFPIRH